MSYIDAKAAPARNTGQIKLYDTAAFEGMRQAGRIAAQALDMLTPHVQPGINTLALDRLVLEFALDCKAQPAPLNYRGFTHGICTSVNHVVCHGIPGDKVLKEGDIINIDVTLIKDGWHGDTSRMYYAGQVARKAQHLITVTYEAMLRGINAIKPGATTGDIGATIQNHVEANRCSVVRDFCGHGLGLVFHDAPNILHYGNPGEGPTLKEGMLFTVEPMVNLGKTGVKILSDGWTAVTRDKSLSAQFEHTVGVTADGVEIFTLSPAGLHCPPYSSA